MRKLLLTALLMGTMALLYGCAWGLLQDERAIDTQTSDSAICNLIKNDMMALNFSQGWNVEIYCYYGHVILVGEATEQMRIHAVKCAERDRRVRSITTHWFEPMPAAEKNATIATRLRTALIGAKGLGSSRIDTVVNSNRVVLLGVVSDLGEKSIALNTAANVKGVNEVTSYLILPQRRGNPAGAPVAERMEGAFPESPAPVVTTFEDRAPSADEPPLVTE